MNTFVRLLLCLCLVTNFKASTQTTVATGLTGSTSITGRVITFAVQNTNTLPIQITDVSNYHNTGNNGATYSLWYTSTQLAGAPTITSPAWTLAATGSPVTITTTGLTPVVTGISVVIPASTTYRFALQLSAGSGTSVYYNGTTTNPTSYSGGGVNLLVGSNAISAGYVGAFPSPATTPRWWCGSITFQTAAAPCSVPLTAGTVTASSALPCSVPTSISI